MRAQVWVLMVLLGGCAQVLALDAWDREAGVSDGGGGADGDGGAPAGSGGAGGEGGVSLVTTADLRWARTFLGQQNKFLGGLAVSATGTTSFCGAFRGTIDLGVEQLAADMFDVFVSQVTAEGTSSWAAQIGGMGNQFCGGATFSGAETLVAGSFTGAIDFNNNIIAGNSEDRLFVARLDLGGNPVTNATAYANNNGPDIARGIVSLSTGIAVAADFSGHLDGGGAAADNQKGASAGAISHIFDGSGSWLTTIGALGSGAPGAQNIRSIAVSGANFDIVVGGSTTGDLDLAGPLAEPMLVDGQEALVVYLDSQGVPQWVVAGTGDENDSVAGVAFDSTDQSVVVTGVMRVELTFESTTVTASDRAEVFVAKLDNAGKLLWLQSYGALGEQKGTAVAVGPGGDIFVVGTTGGPVDFGGGVLNASGPGLSGFVLVLAPDGSHRFSTLVTATAEATLGFVDVDGSGNVVIGGGFSGEMLELFGATHRGDAAAAKHIFVASFSLSETPAPQ